MKTAGRPQSTNIEDRRGEVQLVKPEVYTPGEFQSTYDNVFSPTPEPQQNQPLTKGSPTATQLYKA